MMPAVARIAAGSDYRGAVEAGTARGLLKRRPVFYTAWIAANLLLLAAGWVVFVLVGDSWLQLIMRPSWRWPSRTTGS
jgi:hypothetical protein